MPKNITHRANTNALYYRNQCQKNYTRAKKAQRYQNWKIKPKVKTVYIANTQKVKVTNYNKATIIGLSLLIFTNDVLSATALSNPNTQIGIKKNKQSTKNIQDTTRYQSAPFNDHSRRHQPASKIMPTSIVLEQKSYLTSNQNNLPKVDNNFKNDLNIPKSNQNSSIEKNPQHKLSDSSSILNTSRRLDHYDNPCFYPISYQPPLENNIVREVALFKELLKPFDNLPPLAKEKATLLTISHRLTANVEYDSDTNTAGVEDYWSSPRETLASGGKGIDCEDCAILVNFYAMHAQELSYLPQEAKFGIFRLPGHALFYYERTLPNTDNPEFYVIDSLTVKDSSASWTRLSGENYLKTLKQYTSDLGIYYTFFVKGYRDCIYQAYAYFISLLKNYTCNPYMYFRVFNHYYKCMHIITSILSEENKWLNKESKFYPGNRVEIKDFRTQTIEYWNKRLNNNRLIDSSISAYDIYLLQYNYIKDNGAHSIPEGAEFSKDDIDYIAALEIKNILGYKEVYNKSIQAVTSITVNQAKYLIGSYSQNLDKLLTIHDLPAMTEDQKEKLLGMYSPVLNRQLTNEDVF
jgi:predicted transglutaminase-like cysteine proteinase